MKTRQIQTIREQIVPARTTEEATASLPAVIAHGLPSPEAVRDVLRRIAAPCEAKIARGIYGDLCIPQGELTRYSATDHRRFEVEFQRDLTEMMMRLQRLKLHIAGDLNAGALYNPRSNRFSSEEDDPRIKKMRDIAYVSTQNPAPLPRYKSIKLVTLYNDLVPESLRLSRELPLGIAEQQIIWHTSFKFTGQGDLPDGLREQLEGVLRVVNREQRNLRDITSEPRLFGYTETGISHEHALGHAWKEYRVLVKQLSGIYEQHSWFSPAYDGTHEVQKSPMQGDVVAKMSDYQRWSMSPTKDLERDLQRAFMGGRKYHEHVESFLTSSGLAAFESLLKFLSHESSTYLCHEKRVVSRVFTTGNIYFEVDHAIQAFAAAEGATLRTLDSTDTDRVIRRIKRELPDVVFTTPLANSYKQPTFDVEKLLRELSNPEWADSVSHRVGKRGRTERFLTIAIDNTLAGPTSSWKNFDFSQLPRFVRVFSFESLIKYGEDGLDIAPAGLATCIGEYFGLEFRRSGKSSTASISESTLHRLRLVSSAQQLRHKVIRHHHNTKLLATELAKTASPDAFLTEVNHPCLASHPQHNDFVENKMMAGGLFTVGFNHRYVDRRQKYGIREYESNLKVLALGFEKLVVYLAKEADVEINVGSSFGFNNTRIALYEHYGEKIEGSTLCPLLPHLRIAPGTETAKDIKIIAAVITRANEIFTCAQRMGALSDVCQRLLDGSFSIARI